MKNRATIGIIGVLVLILIVAVVTALQFNENPSIDNNDNLTTTHNIVCRWNASTDVIETNVSWYKNNNLFRQDNNISTNYSIVSSSNTSKGENWECNVTIYNGSTTLSQSTSITVQNTPPTKPVIKNSTNQDIGYEDSLLEDQHTYYTIHSTDADNDTLIYQHTYIGVDFCSVNQNTGAVDCYPTNETGSTQFTFLAHDGQNPVGTVVNLTIIPVNDPPEFSLSNQTIYENETLNYSVTASDDEDHIPLTFTVVPGLTELAGVTIEQINNYTSNIIFEPDGIGGHVGNWTITINVTDTNGSDSKSTIHNFTLEVLEVNHYPNITYISNNPANQTDPYLLQMNATDNYDNNTLNFSITPNCSLTNPWTNLTQVNWSVKNGNNVTSYATANWTGVLTNNHIACRNITITITDALGATDTENILLNISNINDAPTIHNYSKKLDILNNEYIYNLTGYESAPLKYQVNATDPDLLVEYNAALDSFQELLFYNTNETTDTFIRDHLDNNTGLINITAADMNRTGNFTVLITVTDFNNMSVNKTLKLEVLPNSPPTFNQTLEETCFERDNLNHNQSCYLNMSQYASDPESVSGDYVANFTDDSTKFNITNNGIIHFNATQEMVGTYRFNITITDTKGASTVDELTLYINNTNNKPDIGAINTPQPPSAMYHNQDKNNVINIPITDLDLELSGTNTSYSNYSYEDHNVTWYNNNLTQNITSYLSLSNSPVIVGDTATYQLTIDTSLEIGVYNITINVKDNYLSHTNTSTYDNDSTGFVFRIYNTTAPPEILEVYPYGEPQANTTILDWLNLSNTSTKEYTYIGVSENTSMIFNHTAWDENPANLTYRWVYDGTELNSSSLFNYNSSASFYNSRRAMKYYFGFFEAENVPSSTHNLTLTVIDGYDNSLKDNFTWHINVTNHNRPITFNNSLPNVTIKISRDETDMDLWDSDETYGFYDPDYDYDGDGQIELLEGNYSISYTVSDPLCDGFATINVSDPYHSILYNNETVMRGHGMLAKATQVGNCSVSFNATDGEYIATSNTINITVETVGDDSPETIETVEESGTRTVIETEQVEVPVPEEIEKPIPIDIVLPDMVTVYENNSIDIPLTITNTWNQTVMGVRLGYETNDTLNYTVKFERDYFYRLDPGEEIKTKMTVIGYRVGGLYEILVTADVTDPEYKDTAKIYLNSIEQSSTGAQVKTLIRFAQDLLTKNKECQELSEVLDQARESAEVGNNKKALEQLNSVINGCKYLISQEQKLLERPGRLRNIHIPLNTEQILYMILAMSIIAAVTGTIWVFKRKP